MKKMVICNFNDLIDEEDAIPISTMLKLEKLKKNNYLLTIITNKAIKEILDYNKDFPFIDYIITCYGYLIYDVNKNKKIGNYKIPKKDISKVKIMDSDAIFIGENGIVKDNIESENIYQIIVNNNRIIDKINLKVKKYYNKIIIFKEDIDEIKSINKICLLNKITNDNLLLIYQNKSKLNKYIRQQEKIEKIII